MRKLPVLPDNFKDPALPKGTWSISQYNLYKKCGFAYYLKNILGMIKLQNPLAYKGNILHKGVEYSLSKVKNKEDVPLKEALAVVTDAFEKDKESVSWDPKDDTETGAKDKVILAYIQYHRTALPNAKPLEIEWGFATKIGDIPTIGYIDLIDQVPILPGASEPANPIVTDLKYTRTSWNQNDLTTDPQFTLYSLVTGIPRVRVDNLVALKAGPVFKQLTGYRDKISQDILVEDFHETVDAIKKGFFPKAPIDSWQCSAAYCEFYSDCRGKRR